MSSLAERIKEKIRREYGISILKEDGNTVEISGELVAKFRDALGPYFEVESNRAILAQEHGEAKANAMVGEKIGLWPFHSVIHFRDLVMADEELGPAVNAEAKTKDAQQTVVEVGFWNLVPEWAQDPESFRKTFGFKPADPELVTSAGFERRALKMTG